MTEAAINYQDALFKSAHAALTFAFNYSVDQYDRPAMNKMADGPHRQGKGLVGTDGAGQAGLIRRELKDLGGFHEAVLTAYYTHKTLPCGCDRACCCGHKPNPEWSEAIGIITQAAQGMLAGKMTNYRLRRGIVVNAFSRKSEKEKLMDLAKHCCVDRDTASEHNAILAEWLLGDKHGRPGEPVGEINKAIEAATKLMVKAGLI